MKSCFPFLLALTLLLSGCVSRNATERTKPSAATQITLQNSSVISSFSYADAVAMYKEGDPGVKYEGFVNTTASPVHNHQEAIEQAAAECTVDYDTPGVSYDADADIWAVCFGLALIDGDCQTVYLDGDGITHLIVYGE